MQGQVKCQMLWPGAENLNFSLPWFSHAGLCEEGKSIGAKSELPCSE